MENLSVRTLYDKIDDQNMFLTAQLSRHQDDMQGFYQTICQQNDHLKKLLENTDFTKIQKIKRWETEKKEFCGKRTFWTVSWLFREDGMQILNLPLLTPLIISWLNCSLLALSSFIIIITV